MYIYMHTYIHARILYIYITSSIDMRLWHTVCDMPHVERPLLGSFEQPRFSTVRPFEGLTRTTRERSMCWRWWGCALAALAHQMVPISIATATGMELMVAAIFCAIFRSFLPGPDL